MIDKQKISKRNIKKIKSKQMKKNKRKMSTTADKSTQTEIQTEENMFTDIDLCADIISLL